MREFILLTAIIEPDEDSNCWTAKCLELGTAHFGNTPEEAQRNIKEAVKLHLETLKDVGELERFLKEHKIKPLEV